MSRQSPRQGIVYIGGVPTPFNDAPDVEVTVTVSPERDALDRDRIVFINQLHGRPPPPDLIDEFGYQQIIPMNLAELEAVLPLLLEARQVLRGIPEGDERPIPLGSTWRNRKNGALYVVVDRATDKDPDGPEGDEVVYARYPATATSPRYTRSAGDFLFCFAEATLPPGPGASSWVSAERRPWGQD